MSSETAEQTPAVPASPAGGKREWKVRRIFNSILDMSMYMLRQLATVVQTSHRLFCAS